jgi:hypothetical protein
MRQSSFFFDMTEPSLLIPRETRAGTSAGKTTAMEND